jgi:hypothetical protein
MCAVQTYIQHLCTALDVLFALATSTVRSGVIIHSMLYCCLHNVFYVFFWCFVL